MVEALPNPRAEEEFDDYLIRSGGTPIGAEVIREWGFSGAGAGRLSTLRRKVEAVFGNCWCCVGDYGVSGAAANAYLASWGMEVVTGGLGPRRKPRGAEIAESVQDAVGRGWSAAEAARAACDLGMVKAATNVRTRDEVRDFIARGYAVFDGVAWVGYDDRPETRAVHGQALALSVGVGGFRWELAGGIARGIAVSSVLGWPGR